MFQGGRPTNPPVTDGAAPVPDSPLRFLRTHVLLIVERLSRACFGECNASSQGGPGINILD